jgi:hypothetical protein
MKKVRITSIQTLTHFDDAESYDNEEIENAIMEGTWEIESEEDLIEAIGMEYNCEVEQLEYKEVEE